MRETAGYVHRVVADTTVEPMAVALLVKRRAVVRWNLVMRHFGIVALAVLVSQTASAVEGPAEVVPGVLRSHATSAPLPVYPGHERNSKDGRVVVSVIVDVTGRVRTPQILETSDQGMANAVLAAVKKWEFKPFLAAENKKPVEVVGRLIFYFVVRNGRPLVIDAAATVDAAGNRK